MKQESVLVIPAKTIPAPILSHRGLLPVAENTLFPIIQSHGSFLERYLAEEDESFRQVIPYILLQNDHDEFLLMKRLDTQGEKRLHHRYSIGVGGHVHDLDAKEPLQAFHQGMVRELHEEVDVTLLSPPQFIGVINDSATPVGRVHIGMAYRAKVIFRGMNEPDQFAHAWVATDQMDAYRGEMEGWSQLLWDFMKG